MNTLTKFFGVIIACFGIIYPWFKGVISTGSDFLGVIISGSDCKGIIGSGSDFFGIIYSGSDCKGVMMPGYQGIIWTT